MNPEGYGTSPDRNTFLGSYFREEFSKPNPLWYEVPTDHGKWRVAAVAYGNRIIMALRTSSGGTVDSFYIDLDDPENDEHVVVDITGTCAETEQNIDAQTEMGLTALNEDDKTLFEELVAALRLGAGTPSGTA